MCAHTIEPMLLKGAASFRTLQVVLRMRKKFAIAVSSSIEMETYHPSQLTESI